LFYYSQIIFKFYGPRSSFSHMFQVPQVIFQGSSGLVSYSQNFRQVHQIIFPKLIFWVLFSYLSNFSKSLRPYFETLKFFRILRTSLIVLKFFPRPSDVISEPGKCFELLYALFLIFELFPNFTDLVTYFQISLAFLILKFFPSSVGPVSYSLISSKILRTVFQNREILFM
jgi:hypothetical protein